MNVAVVGAGILGLAHAYAYAKRGHTVRIFERSLQAHGASIRNFGLIWPIGQPQGEMFEMAMLSRRIWMELLNDARIPYSSRGSLHLAYYPDEEAVIQEFLTREPFRGRWLNAFETIRLSPAIKERGLRGGLWSDSELMIDPRQVVAEIPKYLSSKFGVEISFGTAVRETPIRDADITVICSGDDFETLYPDVFRGSGLTRCKLQMMRTEPQPAGWHIGPALAAGLTLRFYSSFRACESLAQLQQRIRQTLPEYDTWGIHVMASQMPDGCLTIGDSHEYGNAIDIFNKEVIDDLIRDYLATFCRFPNEVIAERWHGVYAKHPTKPYCVFNPEPGVRIVTGVGGAGMTLSMGLAETLCD